MVGREKSVDTCRYFLLSYFFLTVTSSRRDAVTGDSATFADISLAHVMRIRDSKPVYSNKIGGCLDMSTNAII